MEEDKNKVGRPRKYETVEELSNKIDDYFKMCDKTIDTYKDKNGKDIVYYRKPYTISGLCLYLDICRDTLCEYEKEDIFSDTIKRAKKRVENYIEEHSITGELNPTVSIFNLKNNFGWKDKTEVDLGNKDNKPFKQIDFSNLTTEQIRELLKDEDKE